MSKPLILVGISGGSGSGKTSVLKALKSSALGDDICIVSQDDYYKPITEQKVDENGEVNFDLPSSIDIDQFVYHLKELCAGKSLQIQEYVFNNDAKTAKTIELAPKPILVIEGLFIFYFEAIAKMLNLKVFVHADTEHRLERRIKRDFAERGYDRDTVLYQWENHVEPAYLEFLHPYKRDCDLVMDNNEDYRHMMDDLTDLLKTELQKKRKALG